MRGICLNWKVVAGLAAVGLGIWALAPGMWAAAFPVLIVLACPLSMLFMMRGMPGMRAGSQEGGAACAMPGVSARPAERASDAGVPVSAPGASGGPSLAELKAELDRTRERQDAIARRIEELELDESPAVRQAGAVARSADRR